jgi:hypothetical protein
VVERVSERIAPAELVNEMWEAMVVALMKALDVDRVAAEEKLRKWMREGLARKEEKG